MTSKSIIFLWVPLAIMLSIFIYAQNIQEPQQAPQLSSSVSDISLTKNMENKNDIKFDFTDKNLVTLVNELAAKKDINIIFPQGANAINAKVTIKLDKDLSLNEAWNLLPTILDIAGYSLVPKKDFFTIIKQNNTISTETLELYINIPSKKLPTHDGYIRYLTYLSNIKITKEANTELEAILKELLPTTAKFEFDSNANALLISARANDIRQAMKIIEKLDQVEFQETMKIIDLHHATARIVANLFNEQILKVAGNDISRYRLDTRKQPTDSAYFSKHVRIIAVERTNSLIVLGKKQAVTRIKNFIKKHIDVELESGKSILHVYQLQYLDALEFEPVLDKIVKSTRPGGTEQARAGTTASGVERFFDEVIIKADRPASPEEQHYYGGNKLVIAARNDDWLRIKKLIEELDTPQPQVLLEVLVADITVNDERLLSNILRNPDKIPLPNKVEFQAAHASSGVITDATGSNNEPTTIAPDLLRLGFTDTNNQPASLAAAFTKPGGTVLSLSDNNGQTWSVLQVLKLFGHTKILSHPHIIATNNKEALVRIGETRLVQGNVSGTTGGSAVIKNETIEAELKVTITPRISSGETVNLQVNINVNEFAPGAGDARTTRVITTNANVHTGHILALGGLMRIATDQSAKKTPLISEVPILGWLFKQQTGNTEKTNLTVFISPMIIEPRLRAGVSNYTRDYLNIAREYTQDDILFGGLKDPITRWFFAPDESAKKLSRNFLSKDEITFKKLAQEEQKRKEELKSKPQHKESDTNDQNETTRIKKEHSSLMLQEKVKNMDNPFKKNINVTYSSK